jgi:thiol:disulfide interchange protein DsbD
MKIILAICFSLISFSGFTQENLAPTKWSFHVVDSGEDYIFKATVDLDEGWAIYSQYTEEGGPVPLSFTFKDKAVLKGVTEEKSEAIKIWSELFEVEVIKFKKQAIFEQRFTKKKGMKIFSGELRFMCCDDLRCLPPTFVQFDIGL